MRDRIAVPPLRVLPAAPKRVILHWTGGGPRSSEFERSHYHYLVEQSGTVVEGVPVALNMCRVSADKPYAAHTRGMNSYSVGVSFCGMLNAVQGKTFGPYPLKRDQVLSGCSFVAWLLDEWSLPLSEDTVFTHSEAQSLHCVRQLQKWDIDVLEFLPKTKVGPWLREQVRIARAGAAA